VNIGGHLENAKMGRLTAELKNDRVSKINDRVSKINDRVSKINDRVKGSVFKKMLCRLQMHYRNAW